MAAGVDNGVISLIVATAELRVTCLAARSRKSGESGTQQNMAGENRLFEGSPGGIDIERMSGQRGM